MLRRLGTITAGILLITLWLTGCANHVSIADLTRDPAHYADKEVTISGEASGAVGGFGQGIFQVDDGTGRMWVLSQNYGLPGNGSKVSVTGQVQQGISFGGRNYGVMLRQTKPLN
ncbi:MAG TPA: hypothetical protein VKW06_16770 [Candidatus Angelobacter sp.]|nr:hypothetical protein [Candidatus Angelobacter sp.]